MVFPDDTAPTTLIPCARAISDSTSFEAPTAEVSLPIVLPPPSLVYGALEEENTVLDAPGPRLGSIAGPLDDDPPTEEETTARREVRWLWVAGIFSFLLALLIMLAARLMLR